MAYSKGYRDGAECLPRRGNNVVIVETDRRKFEKTADRELRGYYSLEDIKKGVSYSFSDKDEVTGISFSGSAEDNQKLRCKNRPAGSIKK